MLDEPKFYVNFEVLKQKMESEKPSQLVDTRLKKDFASGHIPGSKSTPFTDFFNEDKTMKSKEDLLSLFRSSKVDIYGDVVATCQIGVTASLAAHALYYATGKDVSVYDGSFAEWENRAPDFVSVD